MMRRLRAAWRLARAVLHGVHGLLIVLLLFPALDQAGRERRIAWWSAKMFRMLGMRLQVQGRFRPGAKLIVANHVSWLDIMAVHAVCPEARFVSKAEVRHWPLVARLVDAARTLYLERGRARDALRVVHQMAEALQQGDSVAVFPEGTVGDGHALLPFHANLLQAAISTQTPVQPVALRYADAAHAVSPAVLFTGEITLKQSLWWLACGEGLVVQVQVLDALGSRHADRRALAAHVQALVAAALPAAPAGSAARAAV
ncbi:MAG: 1-acyl-sn-glycerol-3-phosphate acyltransferase [Rubrivivax sp.]|nr:1-acyl-sn-glycerol-3-phosphate acyltransferase [Rubrivivax sp.]